MAWSNIAYKLGLSLNLCSFVETLVTLIHIQLFIYGNAISPKSLCAAKPQVHQKMGKAKEAGAAVSIYLAISQRLDFKCLNSK